MCVCEDQYICDFNEREILTVKYTFWQKVVGAGISVNEFSAFLDMRIYKKLGS